MLSHIADDGHDDYAQEEGRQRRVSVTACTEATKSSLIRAMLAMERPMMAQAAPLLQACTGRACNSNLFSEPVACHVSDLALDSPVPAENGGNVDRGGSDARGSSP